MAQSPGKTPPAAKAASPSSAAAQAGKTTAKGAAASASSKKSAPKSAARPPAAAPAKTAARAAPRAKAASQASRPARKAPAQATQGNGDATGAQSPVIEGGVVTPEQRYRMICDAAYFRAERRGFVGGSALQDWLEAEAEIDALLREMQA